MKNIVKSLIISALWFLLLPSIVTANFNNSSYLKFVLKKPTPFDDPQIQAVAELMKNKDPQRMDRLRELIAMKPRAVYARDHQQEKITLLMLASYHGLVPEVSFMLSKLAAVDAVDEFDKKTAMHYAAHEGHADVIVALHQKKGDLDAQDQQQTTPLHVAVFRDKINVVKTLVELGADVQAKQHNGDSPLFFCRKESEYRGHTCLSFTSKY